jgi:divalent metal cation (Fe/Co/Zn/Cd) transporter
MIARIRKVAKNVSGVIDTEKCHIRKSGMLFYADLHAIVDGSITVEEGHNIAHHLKDRLKAEIPELIDILIHIEPGKL